MPEAAVLKVKLLPPPKSHPPKVSDPSQSHSISPTSSAYTPPKPPFLLSQPVQDVRTPPVMLGCGVLPKEFPCTMHTSHSLDQHECTVLHGANRFLTIKCTCLDPKDAPHGLGRCGHGRYRGSKAQPPPKKKYNLENCHQVRVSSRVTLLLDHKTHLS